MIDNNEEDKNTSKPKNWIEKLTAFIGGEPQNRSQLMEVLRDAEERGILSAELLGMIECILQVSEMQVREVMIPKSQMVTVNKSLTLDELLPIIIESGHSRFPVLDAQGKEIIGILLAKDLLRYNAHHDKTTFKIQSLIRPAMFTPQSKRLDILLREFRVSRNHIAIVLDEYGHVAGLVTIEDVLEQIVGEIEDEYDIDEDDTQIKKLEDDTYIVRATTLIDEFNDYFKTDFSDEEFDTIGGIVIHGFGRLPKRGESIKLQNLRFKVLHADNRRIYLLEIKQVKHRK